MGYSDISQIFKDIKGVADATANSELNGKVIELQGMVMDLMSKQLDLQRENNDLKSQNGYESRINIDNSNTLVLDDKTDKHYCPLCWGKDRRLNLLGKGEYIDGNVAYYCPTCGSYFSIHKDE